MIEPDHDATRRPQIDLQPDDKVLVGVKGVTMPSDWWLGTVLLARGSDVVLEQQQPDGRLRMRLCDIADIRTWCRGLDWSMLNAFRAFADNAVTQQVRDVTACRTALARAQDAVWSKLAEVGADVQRCCGKDRP